MGDSLLLSDVLGRETSIEWFEAVALVREVAERVRENLAGQSVPELHQVEIDSTGKVSLSGASRTEEPVRRLGQLLQAVLVESEPPVQLRLLASQATAPTPSFPSIREYSDALAYFERPNRAAVLQALYERASSAPAGDVRITPTLDAMAPLEQPKMKKIKEPARANQAQNKRAIPTLAAGVLVIVGGTAYWQYAAATPSSAQVSQLAVKASDVVGTALVSGLSSVSDKVGLGRLAPTDASGSVPPTPLPAPPVTAAATAVRKSPAAKPSAPPFRLFDLAPSAAPAMESVELADEPILPALNGLKPVAPLPEIDGAVYSASDAGVEGPIGVRPQLPAALPADVKREQLSQIELVILPDGTVGAVRLLGRPRSVLEGMLLSAAKAWRFKPAMKDGRPVAYRKLVWLVLQ